MDISSKNVWEKVWEMAHVKYKDNPIMLAHLKFVKLCAVLSASIDKEEAAEIMDLGTDVVHKVLDGLYPNRTCNNCNGFNCPGYYDFKFDDHNYCFNWHPKEEMNIKQYHEGVQRTLSNDLTSKDERVMIGLGIAGEAGEIVDLIKKNVFHGHDVEQETIIEEIGDLMWYVAALCNHIGIILEEVFVYNIEKLKKRYPQGFSCEKSVNREG